MSEQKAFPSAIKGIASKLSVYDSGPFFLQHGDLSEKNIIIDDNYRFISIIDWDRCFAAPWEAFASLPKFVFHVPRGMDAPSRYDENGNPADFKTIKQCARINEHTVAVKRAEDKKGTVPGNSGYCLSQALENTKRHDIASAMSLFVDGKTGFYMKVLDGF